MGFLQRIRPKSRQAPSATAALNDPAKPDSETTATPSAGTATPTTILGPDLPVTLDAEKSSGTGRVQGNDANGGLEPHSATQDGQVASEKASSPESGPIEGDTKDGEEEVEDLSQYPGGWALAILTFGLCMAIFVVSRNFSDYESTSVDTDIVQVALDNTIIGKYHAQGLA